MNEATVPSADRRLTILLADDTADVRMLMRHILEIGGTFVVIAEASNGAEAVELAAHHRPDIVLLDLAMPVMDGLQALPEILARSPGSKVAILSGFAADRLAEQAIAMGAHTYLEKGTPAKELIGRLVALTSAA